ncbi:MAG: cell division protein FtsZ [Alphaproteobacteria bacterium]|tara:strand:+ start:725 stop:2227 length:1503 start_codon:yes stop_codon:yes gene_type:complete
MTLHLKMPSQSNNLSPRILVIGIGGTGGNIINSMINSGIEGVDFLNVNTDSQQLKHSKVEKTLQLGPSCTQGLGAGGDPDMGKKAAEEVLEEIEEYIENANMVFLTAGMGGGTGTGATPVIAKIAKEKNILTVGVVTKPFQMEGKRKIEKAEKGVTELQKFVDNLIVIPNQNIFAVAKPDTPVTDSLQLANDVLIDGVSSIIDLMVKPGIMNHDFADVKSVMSETGKVHLGTGISEGEDRVNEATEKAISNPLLENNSMSGAKGVLINITCGNDTTLQDIDLANNKIREEADENANIIWGLQKDDSYNGKFKISVISTGIDSENYHQNIINNERISTVIQPDEGNQNLSSTQNELKTNEDQPSFLVDLRQPLKTSSEANLLEEDKILKDQHPENNKTVKKSLFGRIFGLKDKEKSYGNKDNQSNTTEQEVESKKIFLNEIQEISDINNNKEDKIVIEDESFRAAQETHLSNSIDDETSDQTSEVNEDLLQIPAFLRRQAN